MMKNCLLVALACSLAMAAPEADMVDIEALRATYNVSDVALPSKTWSGYLEVDANKSLHYMFV